MNGEETTFTPSAKDYWKFIIPSVIGIFLFIVPIWSQGEMTLPVAFMADWFGDVAGGVLPYVTVAIFVIAILMSAVTKISRPAWIMDRPFLRGLFDIGPFWFIARIVGTVFAIMTLFKIGPKMIWSDATGGTGLYDLAAFLLVVFFLAGLFLPLLLDFGLLELCGSLMTKVMRPVFTLPGRSAIDCLASWLGDGTIGVLLTSKQYESGFYSKREAAVIGTTFSFVSVTFSIVVIGYVDLQSVFLQFYLTIIVAGLVAAVICPRIPPLSWKKDTYYESVGKQVTDEGDQTGSVLGRGVRLAAQRAHQTKGVVGPVIKTGLQNVLDMWIGVVPIVMALATLANIVTEYTSFFEYLGAPFIPLLHLLHVPEAAAAAQTMVVGFSDMLIPSVIASDTIDSTFTRFIVAGVSVTQLIYMSEVGALLLSSKIPVKFLDLVIVFLERTIITLPVVVLMAYLLL